MGKIKPSRVTDTVQDLSTTDWIDMALGLDPEKPLEVFRDITSEELDMPSAPPPPPVLEDSTLVTPDKKKRKFGRTSTILTSPSGLSDIATTKPTLLGQ